MNEIENTIDDLLVDWELARSAGREMSAQELCADHPDLLDQVAARMDVLKALSWAGEPDELIDSSIELIIGPSMDTQLPDTDVTVAEFVEELSSSGVLGQGDLQRIESDFVASQSERARELASRLVQAEMITPYQARVILERGDSPLLLDRYVILDSIGAGGMGIVFKALHKSLERVVAIKVLPKHAVDSPEKVERFQREMRAAAKVAHPNLVQAFDAHESNGVYFFAMEYVSGKDLFDWVQTNGPMPVSQAIGVIAQAANGLASAHEMGLVHRDVKPSNILLADNGKAKVLDLGLSRSMELTQASQANNLTRDGLAMGTVAYMSPEQAFDARTAEARSDIYSLGATLYFLVQGRAMFDLPNSVQIIVAHREVPAPALGADREEVSPQLERLFQSMVAKKPEDRPQTMIDVREQLTAITSSQPSERLENTTVRVNDSVPEIVVTPRQTRGKGMSRTTKWLAVAMVLIPVIGWAIYSLMPDNNSGFPATKPLDADGVHLLAKELLVNGDAMIDIEATDGFYMVEAPEDLPADGYKLTGVTLYSDAVGRLERLAALPDLLQLSVMSVSGLPERPNLDGINRLRSLDELILDGCVIDEETVEAVASLPSLTKLSLDGCEFPGGIAGLSKMQKLAELSMMETDVSDSDLEWLQDDKSLVYLDLSNTRVTPNVLKHLVDLENLQSLNLTAIELSDDIRLIANLKGLTQLMLDGTDLEDRHVAALTKLNLQILDVGYTNLTKAGVSEVANIQALQDLSLSALPVNHAMKAFAALPSLDTLDLTDTDLKDAGLSELSKQRNLQILYIGGADVSDISIDRFLKRVPSCDINFDRGGF